MQFSETLINTNTKILTERYFDIFVLKQNGGQINYYHKVYKGKVFKVYKGKNYFLSAIWF